jgi:hypothetical protein
MRLTGMTKGLPKYEIIAQSKVRNPIPKPELVAKEGVDNDIVWGDPAHPVEGRKAVKI